MLAAEVSGISDFNFDAISLKKVLKFSAMSRGVLITVPCVLFILLIDEPLRFLLSTVRPPYFAPPYFAIPPISRFLRAKFFIPTFFNPIDFPLLFDYFWALL